MIFSGVSGDSSGEGAVDGVVSCDNVRNCFIGRPDISGSRNWLAVDMGLRTMIRRVTLYGAGVYNF